MNKLNKCPFCKTDLHISVVGNEKDYYKVRCGCCGGSTGAFVEMKPAIDYWNNAKTLIVDHEIHGFPDIHKINEIMRLDIVKLKEEKQTLLKQISELERDNADLKSLKQMFAKSYETAHGRLVKYLVKAENLMSVIEDAYTKMVEIDKSTKEAGDE